jgi:DNA replication and repair protein RecF
VNLFIGVNGQGKTNLLEAVAMLALSSSPRSRRELELIGPVAPMSRIEAEVESAGIRAELAITLTLEGDRARRVIEVDGVRRRAFDLPGRFRVTLFWPDDLGLVKAGPELRRRFLNQMLVQVEPGYARALAGLKRVLEQRNSLLKKVAAGDEGEDVLEAWDQELVRIGGEVVAARAAAVLELEPEAARYHAEIAAGEHLEIRYEGPPQNLAEAVHNSRAEDLRRGSTTVGPHRDDMRVVLGGQEARAYASQGQQRTAVVSLKLAEAALVTRRTGQRPVLLLDDVLSELDAERRASLLRQVAAGGQVIITSAEAGPFPPDLMASAMVWMVSQGKIQPCG